MARAVQIVGAVARFAVKGYLDQPAQVGQPVLVGKSTVCGEPALVRDIDRFGQWATVEFLPSCQLGFVPLSECWPVEIDGVTLEATP